MNALPATGQGPEEDHGAPVTPSPVPYPPAGFANTLFEQCMSLWVRPEIEARRQRGSLPADFKMRVCRVLFPRTGGRLVELNSEVGWETRLERGRAGPIAKGDPLLLEDYRRVVAVRPPKIADQEVGFVFLFHRGKGVYSILFNFDPTSYPPEGTEWDQGRTVAGYLNDVLLERVVVEFGEKGAALLEEFGLFMAPAIIPYPLGAIVVALRAGRKEEAARLLRDECKRSLWDARSETWWGSSIVARRRGPIVEALDAHFRGHFHASIYALYPSLVGIVADALVEHDATHSAYAKDEKKVEKFIAIARDRLPDSFAWRKILSAPLAFIQSGLFFKRFFDWGDPVNVTFPSRHALLHGKYDEAMFTEENSLKAILLLDSLINVLLATAPRESDVRADPGPGLAPDGPPTMEPPVAG